MTVNLAANRDPDHYDSPDDVRLDRPAPRDHLAFHSGPRTCIGAALARIELQESIAAFLERFPDARLDPDAESPCFQGPDALVPPVARALWAPGGVTPAGWIVRYGRTPRSAGASR